MKCPQMPAMAVNIVRKVMEAGRVTSAAEGPQIARGACVKLQNRRGKEGA